MKRFSRREFLGLGGGALLCGAARARASWPFADGGEASRLEDAPEIMGGVFRKDAPRELWKWSREAMRYEKLEGGRVRCRICPHHCLLAPGDRSVCRSRVNLEGTLYTLVYGNPCAVHVDPVEKKPLYHYTPGARSFSIATSGCNLRCLNCQNWEISQAKPHEVRTVELFPRQVVAEARKARCSVIAYTYSEPVTFFEYMLDTARLAHEAGIANVWVSAGYIERAPLLELCKWLDAANVNLKAFSDLVYRKLNGARLRPILNTFETLNEQSVHFEMTHLVVPGYVDDEELAKRMCGWILDRLGPDHPLHFTRFFPKYKLDRLAPTPVSTLERFRELALSEGIRYVYVGNVPGHEGNHTYCHNCGKRIVDRRGYDIAACHIDQGRCEFCRTVIPGVWRTPAPDAA